MISRDIGRYFLANFLANCFVILSKPGFLLGRRKETRCWVSDQVCVGWMLPNSSPTTPGSCLFLPHHVCEKDLDFLSSLSPVVETALCPPILILAPLFHTRTPISTEHLATEKSHTPNLPCISVCLGDQVPANRVAAQGKDPTFGCAHKGERGVLSLSLLPLARLQL